MASGVGSLSASWESARLRLHPTGTATLTIIDDEAGLSVHRKPGHLQAQRGAGEGLRPMHRDLQRQQPKLSEAQGLDDIERGAQMAEMDRVEGASEDADHAATAIRGPYDWGALTRIPPFVLLRVKGGR